MDIEEARDAMIVAYDLLDNRLLDWRIIGRGILSNLPNEIGPEFILSRIHPDDHEIFASALERIYRLRLGETITYRLRVMAEEGDLPISCTSTPLLIDERGRPYVVRTLANRA